MSIFAPATPRQIARNFTHRGWLALCPVYVNRCTWDVCERNGIPEWWLSVSLALVEFVGFCRFMLGMEVPDGWPILFTGPVEREGDA